MVQCADPGTRTTNSYSNCKTNRDVTNTVASFVLQFNKTNSLILILKKCLPDKLHLILILFLILKKYSFVNHSHIFRITTKENTVISKWCIPSLIFYDWERGYRPWLFQDCVYLYRHPRAFQQRYRPWLFPGCVYLRQMIQSHSYSYRPWLFPGCVYRILRGYRIRERYRPWLFPGCVYLYRP